MANPKNTLLKLNKNLNLLQEREAKYGGNAPLELLNQIDDHRQAIELTEQAITGELSEAEWREALKSLLLAVQNGQVVKIEAQTYIAGDVKGDIVYGEKIITHIYEAPPPPLPPAEAKERRELGILLGKVKQFWIEGVLEKSIHNIALIDLGKETQAEAVAHAWEQVLELPDQSRQTLPPDKKISQIFREMNRALLILGAPGSGKSITLLQLARDLVTQAEHDESFVQPVPAVFNLATWTEGQPLVDWLAAELSAKYQIPKRIGQPWLENHRLLPLLDGLDEVKPKDRAACVEAINQFGAEFGLSGLVVCSRLEEYINLPVRLKLNGAIRLQPLSLEQVYDYLEAAGSKLDALRVALQVDDSLQTLAQIPLTLGVMTLAYQNMPVESLTDPAHETIEARRKHLFDVYIERMFRRKGKSDYHYGGEQTKGWLTWLAQQMIRHNQSIFLIEQLQPSWLPNHMWLWIYVFGSRLISMLFGGLMLALVLILGAAPIIELIDTPTPEPREWLMIGLLLGLTNGLILGLIDGIRIERSAQDSEVKKTPNHWQQGINTVVVGLIFVISTGLILGMITGGKFGLFLGLIVGLNNGLFFGLRGSRQSLTNDIQTVEALSWSWNKAIKNIPFGLIIGLCLGLVFGLIIQLDKAIMRELDNGLIFRLTDKQNFLLIYGLCWGVFCGALTAMFGGLSSEVVVKKTIPNQGIWLSSRNALITGLGFGLTTGLISGSLGGLLGGFWWGVDAGLGFGLAAGAMAFLWYGGFDIIQHYILRFILWYRGHTPRNYAHFLDYAANRIFLQKVGGGYQFIHRLLMEHFAAMNEMENVHKGGLANDSGSRRNRSRGDTSDPPAARSGVWGASHDPHSGESRTAQAAWRRSNTWRSA